VTGPGPVCAGCQKPTSFYKPICDDCMRASGQVPTPAWQLELLENGIRKRKLYQLTTVTSVEEFNKRAPIGSHVLLQVKDGHELSTTRSTAWMATEKLPVVLVNSMDGSCRIDCLQVVEWIERGLCADCCHELRQAGAGGGVCDRCVPP
jgi:hypothetical protein